MILKSLIQTKDELVTVQEDISLAEALDILEDTVETRFNNWFYDRR